MIRVLVYSLLAVLFFVGCEAEETKPAGESETPAFVKDLDEIKKDGKLKALLTYSGTSYFLYRGQPMGYEYELLKRLAEHLDLELEITISRDIDDLLDELNRGEVDLVAHGLTVISERMKKADFTDYLYLTRQVLVQKKPDNWLNAHWAEIERALKHDAIELLDDTISVRKNSSYLQRINNLANELGGVIHIDTLDGNLSTDRIIKMVVDGDIKYTIADDNLAKINAANYPILNVDVPVSFSQKIAWAVRKTSPKLLAEINSWLQKERKDVGYYVIYNRYFKDKHSFRKRNKSELYSLNANQISNYDELIKRHAEELEWDWRLLAALVFHESKFDPEAKSWAGAKGLMQLMPVTAKELGVGNRANPKENLSGGARYLQQLYDSFEDIPDSLQRIKFAMASYNCGYGHVLDAQSLAKVKGLNPLTWDENVEKMILELSYPESFNHEVVKYGYVRGIEPYKYVEYIFETFEHYQKFVNI